jgi:hypothetical protein
MLVLLLVFLLICIVIGSTAELGAPALVVIPVGIVLVIGLVLSSVVGSGRSSREVLRDTPKAELLGPGARTTRKRPSKMNHRRTRPKRRYIPGNGLMAASRSPVASADFPALHAGDEARTEPDERAPAEHRRMYLPAPVVLA